MSDISEMVVVQVIASCISMLGIVLGFIFTWSENKRIRYVEIITNQTIKNMLFFGENTSLFFSLTKPEVIVEMKSKEKSYKFELMKTVSNIESILKYRFEIEREIINEVREVTKQCFEYFESPTKELEKKIDDLNQNIYKLISIYDYADWQYIKAQAKTRPYKDVPDYNKIYCEQKIFFDCSEFPRGWH